MQPLNRIFDLSSQVNDCAGHLIIAAGVALGTKRDRYARHQGLFRQFARIEQIIAQRGAAQPHHNVIDRRAKILANRFDFLQRQ